MRIGEAARRAGTTTRALRFYESQGLLDADRSANGYREYDERDVRMLVEIRSLQAEGLSLEETRPFVECLRAGNAASDSCADSFEMYSRKLTEVDAQIERLQAIGAALLTRQASAAARDIIGCRAPGNRKAGIMITDTALVRSVTDETFAQEVLARPGPVLVDFWAQWCPPFHMIAAILAKIAAERAGALAVRSIDYDANPVTGARYRVMSLPTLILFVAGEPVATIVGAQPKARLQARIDDALR